MLDGRQAAGKREHHATIHDDAQVVGHGAGNAALNVAERYHVEPSEAAGRRQLLDDVLHKPLARIGGLGTTREVQAHDNRPSTQHAPGSHRGVDAAAQKRDDLTGRADRKTADALVGLDVHVDRALDDVDVDRAVLPLHAHDLVGEALTQIRADLPVEVERIEGDVGVGAARVNLETLEIA